MGKGMPKSPSNRALLVDELRQVVLRYRSRPSTLLTDLESFMDSEGIGVGQHRRKIEKEKESQPDLIKQIFEEQSDFPGWDAL
jgi:hypothetical protein